MKKNIYFSIFIFLLFFLNFENLKAEEIKNDVFSSSIWKNSDSQKIKSLQIFLKENWFYKWEIDWKYNLDIINIVYNFQIKNGILKNSSDLWAWYWWQKTRKLFQKNLKNKSEKIEKLKKREDKNIFLNFKNTDENIKDLENIFKEIWFLDENDILNRENFSKNIFNFQKQENILQNETDLWAWIFWPKTSEVLKKKYELFIDEKINNERKIINLKKKYKKIEIESTNKALEKIKKLNFLKKWDVSAEVRELQNIFKELGYFEWNTTAIFWEKTEESIKNFQKDFKIENEKWFFWEKTKQKLKEKLIDIFKNSMIIQEWLRAEDIEMILEK